MSKSRKKTPITGWSLAKSEKKDKKIWHKRYRAKERDNIMSLDVNEFDLNYLPVDIRQVSNPWCMRKDGKYFLSLGKMIRRRSLSEAKEIIEKIMRK